MPPPNPHVATVKYRQHHGRIQQFRKRLISIIRRSGTYKSVTASAPTSETNHEIRKKNSHPHRIHRLHHRLPTRIRAINLGRKCQLPPRRIPPRPLRQRMRSLPRQRPTRLDRHLDPTQQIRNRLPRQQRGIAPTIIALGKRQRGVKGGAHDADGHGADQHGGDVEAGADDGDAGAGGAEQVGGRHAQLRVLDVRARAGGVSCRREVAAHAEGGGFVARDVGARDEEDHDGGAGVGGGGGSRRAADDGLEFSALEVPACAVGGPYLEEGGKGLVSEVIVSIGE